MQTSVSHPPSAENILYSGGNEVFLSFLDHLLQSIDQGLLPENTFKEIVKSWGAQIARRSSLSQELDGALEQLAEILSLLGLVRVFEPASTNDRGYDILVLRCLFSRHVGTERVKRGIKTFNIIPLFVEGALQAAGHACQLEEKREGMLRNDEYILSLRME